MRGKVGVTGIARGGVRAGRVAACFAHASVTNSLLTGVGNAVRVSCLNGLARIREILLLFVLSLV
jgi:hypothetical protein